MYRDLINVTIEKIESSIRKDRPMVRFYIKGQKEEALYDTGAALCCMNTKTFRRLFPAGSRPKKVHSVEKVSGATGTMLTGPGMYELTIDIGEKKVSHNFHIFDNLKTNIIVGCDFMHKTGLSYDAGRKEFFFSNGKADWVVASLQLNEKTMLEPMSNKMVTANVISRDGCRIGQPCDAVAAICSEEHIIKGGPALVRINRNGQALVELFNCTSQPITIDIDAEIGIVEKICESDQVAELNVEEMTATVEQKELSNTPISESKKKFIMENTKLTVPDEFKKKYMDLLMKHHEVISDSKYDLGQCLTSKHDIQLRDKEPVYIKQFRIPEAHRKAVEDHVKELLKLGVVRPSRSKYNSPVFIVTKKDGGLRIVQDFRALNQKTLVDKYSMRDVQECIDEIGRAGSTIFSAIDLTAGFWQMLLEPECRKFTAFTLPGVGQFEWNASPMGLLGAPGSFQRLMEIVIHNLKNVIAYIDDLLVHTKDHNQHLEILDELFTRLRKHGLKLNLPKSHFGCREVGYLGFRLTPEGVKPGIDKLKAVSGALPPNDVHEVRQFLGLCNFFRGHVKNFAQITAPLNALTRKDCP